jgi:hypothetical protein
MKCRRVEKLIPLYVEGDLASGIADRIATHLDWCGRCNWLADDYRESQMWLRSSNKPEFNEADLHALKSGVLARIADATAKPSLLASLAEHWNRRQVLALSVSLLIIFGVVVFYIYQASMSPKPRVIEAKIEPPDSSQGAPGVTPTAVDQGTVKEGSLKKPGNSRNRASIKPRSVAPMIAQQASESPTSQTPLPERPGKSAAEPVEEIFDSYDSEGTLRIELQTSDPNIRIIWFAPKGVEGPNTNE